MTGEPDSTPTPQEQLQAALERFNAVNQTLPAGMQPFQLPPFLEIGVGVDALANLLLEKGLIEEQEFIDRKTLRMAEMVDHLAGQASEVKRQALGIILAAPGSIPQNGAPGSRPSTLAKRAGWAYA